MTDVEVRAFDFPSTNMTHDPGLFQTDTPPPSVLREASPGKFGASAAPLQLKQQDASLPPRSRGGNTDRLI